MKSKVPSSMIKKYNVIVKEGKNIQIKIVTKNSNTCICVAHYSSLSDLYVPILAIYSSDTVDAFCDSP